MSEEVSNGDCVKAGKLWVDKHGAECWLNLCAAWNMPQTLKHEKSKEIFLAGLAMGFVEALKFVRDHPDQPSSQQSDTQNL